MRRVAASLKASLLFCTICGMPLTAGALRA